MNLEARAVEKEPNSGIKKSNYKVRESTDGARGPIVYQVVKDTAQEVHAGPQVGF
jgi:hypothetical protein